MLKIIAGKNEDGLSALKLVKKLTSNMPLSLIHKAFRKKRIKINGNKANLDSLIFEGDDIELYINDEFLQTKTEEPAPLTTVFASNLKLLDIVYEDSNLAFISKPAGILSHSDISGDVSILELFTQQLIAKGEYNLKGEISFRPALCNRIDRGTSGIVIAAKNYHALKDMNEIIKNGELKKTYKCICYGKPPQGVQKAYLVRDKDKKMVSIHETCVENAKEIITGIKISKMAPPFYLCEINLITGRTHQIRAHLAYLDTPILGDTKYGNMAVNKNYSCYGQMLCAFSVEFSEKLTPPENTLGYLSNREVIAPCESLDAFWKTLYNNHT